MDEKINENGTITYSEKVDPIVVKFKIKPKDWEQCGTCWRAIKEAPELYADGINTGFLEEEEMKEDSRNISLTMKLISDVFSADDDDPLLQAKTEQGQAIFDWNQNKKPEVDVVFTIEQLPFK